MQCCEKIKKLKGVYRKSKSHNKKTGRNRVSEEYVEKLDNILGHKPVTQPLLVLKSSLPNQEDSTEVPSVK